MYSISLLLLALIGATAAADPFADAQNPCEKLRRATLVCASCETLAFCIQDGGVWQTVALANCVTDNHFFCNEEQKSCRYQSECKVTSGGTRFDCQMPGKYPDPYNCKHYHTCDANNKDKREVCGLDERYSARYGTCIPATSGSCSQPAYSCEYVGDRGAWPEDPRIYYVCFRKVNADGEEMIYPLLYRCEDGKVFNGRQCTPSSYTAPTLDPEVKPTTAPTNTAVCATNRLVADGDDCHVYYKCTGGQVRQLQCPPGTYFNKATSSCTAGNC